ncbi:relaxase/mobilization nuclease domain-containing protein [Pseudomonas aeruginosa]|uniref:relaxase/mobilization nuclease domain-containing protein n=1 Tax=Pseudomonas aeruginosa TaxID=287 RepID=UPI00104B4E16|nr:hypothetical protein [Pseudomonas aeruginosa]
MAYCKADGANETAKRKTSEGDRNLNTKASEFSNSPNVVFNKLIYQLLEKDGKKETLEARGKYYRTNATSKTLSPDTSSEEYKGDVNELSKAVSAAFEENFYTFATKDERKNYELSKTLSGSTNEDRKQIQKAFLAFNYSIGINDDEAKGLSEEEKAELLHAMNEYMIKKLTNSKTVNSLYSAAVHFNTGKPHLHCMLSYHDFNGKKLNLQDNYLKINEALIELENHKYFGKFLNKTNTIAAELKNKPTLSIKEETEALLSKSFSPDLFNYKETHKMLISNKIVVKPMHKKTLISRNGMDDIDIKFLDTKIKVGIERYLEIKQIQEKHKKYDLGETLNKVKSLITENSNLTSNELKTLLNSQGFDLIENRTKNGHLNGLSIKINEINETIKMSTLGIKKKDLPNVHIDLKTGKRFEVYQGSDGIMIIDGNGNHRLLRRTAPKKKAIFCFMPDSGWNYDILLGTHYLYSDDNKTFYNKHGKPRFQIVKQDSDNSSLQVSLNTASASDAKAVIQLYLVNGFSGVRITRSGSPEQSRELWRQGQLLGAEVAGYEPSKEDLAWLKEQREKAIEQVRMKNLEAFKTYNETGKFFEVKVVENQWLEVDRKPIAYAYVDLLKLGLNPYLLQSPPRKSGKRGTKSDLTEYYHLILSTVAKEAPELLEKAKKDLEPYKPKELELEKIEKKEETIKTSLYAELDKEKEIKESPKPSIKQEIKPK